MFHLPKNKKRGAALLIVIFFFISVSLAIIQSATIGAVSELRTYHTLAMSKFAYVAAEAGIEDVFYRIIYEKQIPSSAIITLNGATSTVTVQTVSDTQKDIYATGVANSSQTRKLYLSARKATSVQFPNGAQVGEGGIILRQNATIDGAGLANGDVYSDGQIVGATGVTISGNAISSSGMVADQTASSTLCESDEVVGNNNPNIDFAQSFQISTSSTVELSKISLYIKRDGNATGANIRITADAGGQPATTALASQSLHYSLAATSYGWVDVSFATPATLSPSTTYWLVFDSTQDNSKFWYWCRSNASTYASGAPWYKQNWSTAGAWTSVSGDMTFKITFGGGISKIDSVAVSGIAKADAITGSTVTGDAYYQSISGSSVTGTSYPGSPTPPYASLPISTTTIAQWKADALSGGTINGDCGIGGLPECNTLPMSIGPKKIVGNFDVDGGNDETKILTINGTLHITGNLIIQNKGKIKCAFEYLGNSCIIIVDGYVRVRNNAVLSGSGSGTSFLLVLSTKEGCLGSGGSGCSTNDSAIAIENGVDGALFYTTESLIDISNTATVTAIVGYMIQLQNGSTVLYNAAVANLTFTATATSTTGAWNASRWNEF
jgi:hypothetical protein